MTDQAKATPETAVYPPSAETVARAHIDASGYDAAYARSVSDPEGFWAEEAKRLDWIKAPSEIRNVDFTLG
ncbi:acetyl-coenzyme A synthetase N-terminal domain-containing protein, partial [Pseudoponticoccus marisrubri]|uniref:acetyl-coenzyme A synthetase N-terminal domain-containing protein n=1 Tax=Pseudoponticoccus marisrubri TaxID=1685382 RepID=UPI000A84D98F